jgi:lipopolysaccharide export system protein LptC
MGVLMTVKIMRLLIKEWTLPEEMRLTWDVESGKGIALAEQMFHKYLADGWMAFSDDPSGRTQIFTFNPQLDRILLFPPLGGG